MRPKRLLPALLGLFVLFLTIPDAWAQFRRQCDRAPVLYEDSNFRGRSFTLNRHVDDLHDRGFGDEASSVCVPDGWRIVLYSDTGLRGDRLELEGPDSISDLKRDRRAGRNWGDRISSAEVFEVRRDFADAPPGCDRFPMLFKDRDFRGRSIRLDQDQRNLGRLGFGDDASSVCVPQGWTVDLYEDDDFRGDRLNLKGGKVIADLKRDRPQGRDWGDRISSARIVRRDSGRRFGATNPRRDRFPDRQRSGGVATCDRVPVLFEHADYRGRRLNLTASVADLSRSRFGDQASSVCVPSGWRVVLYEDYEYRGRRLELRGGDRLDNLDNNGWNDRVRSVEVEAPRRRR